MDQESDGVLKTSNYYDPMNVYNYSSYGCMGQISDTASPTPYVTSNKPNCYNYAQNDSLSSSSSTSSIKDFSNSYNDTYAENTNPSKTSSILVDYYNCKSEFTYLAYYFFEESEFS
ncbi:unnamed protein product [Brachionus calyciflorus]|uniref:Uncharacterized protein n=1 Tax=Brachionus calyciflorus TaxID=104777 RepID=A0A813NHU4_9BILA|nr:unnamed protein product [Brachionus calyciflorus]